MRRLALVVAAVALAACGGDDDAGGDAPVPLVDQIAPALAAVDARYGSPQEFFEASADLEGVGVIVAVDDATAAERLRFEDGELSDPEPLGEASGATFRAGDVAFDTETIFDGLRAELDDPVIVDFAVQGSEGGAVYDATVASDNGGVLMVLLGPDGRVLAVQAVG